MISIIRNKNFSNWFDVCLFGKLIDSTTSQAKAMKIAKAMRRKDRTLQIITEENTNA